MTILMSSSTPSPSSDPHRVDAILERMRDFVVESDAPITRDDLDVILGALSRASSPRGLLACLPFRASDGGNALAFLAILVPGFRNDGRGGPRRVRTLVDDAQAAAAAVSLRLAETAVTLAASDATVSPSPVAAWLWQAAGTLSGLTAATTSDMATPTPTDHPDTDMPTKLKPLGPTILNYLFAHKDDAPHTRCASTVASAVTFTHRRYINAMKAIQKLIKEGKVTCETVDNWAQVVSLVSDQKAA